MADPPPLRPFDIAARLAPLVAPGATGLVLAVSGGPDSMALMHLVAALRGQGVLPPVAVGTVDHGLRAGSAADAARVEAAAAGLGLPCHRLVWSGPKPSRAVQERAREARYGLLAGLCADIGADHLVTAHTRDDQAETVLFRLLRGSGVAGLGGMAGVAGRGDLRLVRPLLDIAKARLAATCLALGVVVSDDPANHDPRFARARLRRVLPLLAAEGFDTVALTRLATRMARADEALRHTSAAAFGTCLIDTGAASGRLDGVRLAALPREIGLRVLARAIAEAGGATGRLDRLERLVARIADAVAGGTDLCATLGGTVVTLSPEGILDIAREPTRWRGRAFSSARAPRPPLAVESFPWQP